MFRSPRPFVLCAALLSGVLASPTTSDACWFHGTFAPRTTYRPLFPRTTYYAPTTAYYPSTACCTTANYTTANYVPTTTYYAPSSSCCTTTNYAPSQTCNYVPTTTYRQQVVSTPVTGYRAITRYNWLTGWPVTRYRPVTTYVQHVQYQPTTSYRLQCTPNYVAPATSYPSTTPTTQPGDTAAPSMAPGTATPQNTFRPETDANGTTGQPTRALKPIPDANTDGASDAVETGDDGSSLLLQNPNNHTAQASTGWRIRTAVSHEDELRPRVIPAVDSNPVNANAVKKPVISSDGWRAAKKK